MHTNIYMQNAIQTTSKCFISRFIIGTIGQNEQLETQSNLLDVLNTYEGQDGHENITPINVIKEIYASNKPFMLAMMHLSYSELFQNVRIWASLSDENSLMVQPRSDALHLERAAALAKAEEEGSKLQLETDFDNRDEMLNNLFQLSSHFSYLKAPNKINKTGPQEDLIGLIDKDKIISSLRVETLHNILVEGVAMMELSEINPYYTFTNDKIIWDQNYWRYLTSSYSTNRKFLSHDKVLMNIARFSLFSLLESRFHRVESKNYQDTFKVMFQDYLLQFKKVIDSQTQILLSQKTILSHLLSEQGSGYNPPLLDLECPPCTHIPNQFNPPELTIIIRKLNTIVEIITKLGSLHSFKDDLKNLFKKLGSQKFSKNLIDMETNLNSFISNYNTTLNLFTNINDKINIISNFYEDYKLIYVGYSILAIVSLLVLLKIMGFILYLLAECKECGQVLRDFQAFRKERNQNFRHGERTERAYPLMAFQN